ncbi:MAG: hypothetical protein FJ088_00960 [Deltaproteobacteria bacterium]|nr:hypothetical protein [Deltaproteobacteria bacterium]
MPVQIALQVGCVDDITLPECSSLSECPAEYSFCRNGYCLKESEPCAAISSGDGCCPSLDGREGDGDCAMFSMNLSGILPSEPLASGDGGVYVNYFVTDARGKILSLIALDRSGNARWSKKVGAADSVSAPVKTSLGVASLFSDGIRIFDPESGNETVLVLSPSIPLAVASDGADMIAFTTVSKALYASDVTKGKDGTKKIYEPSEPLSMFFVGNSLFVLEDGRYLNIDPVGAKIKQESGATGEAVTGATSAGNRVAFAVEASGNNTLKILQHVEGKFAEVKQISLPEEDFFDPLFDNDGNIFMISKNGFVKAVNGKYDTSEFAINELKGSAHGIQPAVGEGSFIYAFASKNSRITGLRYNFPQSGGGSMLVEWSFSLPFTPSAPLAVTSDNRVVVVEKGGAVMSIWGQ